MKKALTIAGSDSGGGAGVQADLKTFSARGVFGMSVITALTAQNTKGVQGICEVPPEFVEKQIDSVMSDIGADVWKTGMLSNAAIVETVAKCAEKYEVSHLVVDPVMVAKGGDSLLNKEAREVIVSELLPRATLLTPNHHEAEVLTGVEIQTVDDMCRAAEALLEVGAKAVVVKGGHLPVSESAVDIFTDGQLWISLGVDRVDTTNSHGTGCTFASCIAAELAKGQSLWKAVFAAKLYLTASLKRADILDIGEGHGPPDHFLGQVPSIEGVELEMTVLK